MENEPKDGAGEPDAATEETKLDDGKKEEKKDDKSQDGAPVVKMPLLSVKGLDALSETTRARTGALES